MTDLDTTIREAMKPLHLSELPKEAVEDLQGLLDDYLPEDISVDGILGPQTYKAYKEFAEQTYATSDFKYIGLGTLGLLQRSAESAKASKETKETLESGALISIPGVGTVYKTTPVAPDCGISWSEMTKGGTRIPVSAAVSKNIQMLMVDVAKVRQLPELQEKPWIVTSGYRPPAVNAAVGGAPNSYHLGTRGAAVDFYVPKMPLGYLFDIIWPHWKGGCAVSHSKGFMHLDSGPRRTWRY